MSITETGLQTMPTAAIETVGKELEVTASTPTQMAQCQAAMIAWMTNKCAEVQRETDELCAAYEHAKKMKWRSDVLKKHWELSAKRVIYYTKLRLALEAGFYIVPPFPVTVFAIRTEKSHPKGTVQILRGEWQHNFQQEPQVLAPGAGEYQNPNPVVEKGDFVPATKPSEQDRHEFYADEWANIVFPVNMCKPRIMEATSRAMALKVFDDLGVLPQDFKRNPDPVILGRIYSPVKPRYGEPKMISFMIGWHLNTAEL